MKFDYVKIFSIMSMVFKLIVCYISINMIYFIRVNLMIMKVFLYLVYIKLNEMFKYNIFKIR